MRRIRVFPAITALALVSACGDGYSVGNDGTYQAVVISVQLEKKGSTEPVALDDLPVTGTIVRKD